MSATVPVSVILPIRDAAAHLSTAIYSVATQEPRPAEILVIDGDSADDSVAIANGITGVRVIHQTGRGLAAARNEAVRESSHPLVAFCDADDRWTAGALAVRIAAMAANPEALAVIGLVVREEIEGTIPTAAQRERVGRVVPGFTPGAMLVRREAFNRIGWFDESLSIGADSDWFVRLHQSGHPALRVETVVLRKGVRGTSLSADITAYRRDLLTVARRFISRQREDPGP
jgi:glycosyltransferase involved in cell wall biosynthesis